MQNTLRPRSLLFVATALQACVPTDDLPDPCVEERGKSCVLAGTGVPGFNEDGEAAHTRTFYEPMDVIAVPGSADFVVTDWNNHRVRLVAGGTTSTLIGTLLPGDGDPSDADRTPAGAQGSTVGLNHPTQGFFDADGTLVLASWHNHRIRTYDMDSGIVHVTAADTPSSAGSGANSGFSGDGGPAMQALFFLPSDIVQDPDGNYLVLDQKNQRIRKIEAGWGTIQTVAGFADAANPFGFAGDGEPLANARFHFPAEGGQPPPGGGLLAGPDGRVFVADTGNHCVRVLDFANDRIDRVAGTGTAGFGGDGGPALDASFDGPRDLAWGADGRLLVADTDNHRIRAIDLTTGVVQTIAGNGSPEPADSELLGAQDGLEPLDLPLDRPYGIDVDDEGGLLIADTGNHVIRRIAP